MTHAHRVNGAARALIKRAEGLELTAYRCPAGKWTIGWGHTGPDVHRGLTITQAQAEALFERDLEAHAAPLARLCPVASDNQFSAMTSLMYNIGEGNFARSSVRRKHNAGDFAGAAVAFKLWIKATVDGQRRVLRGLVERREAEARLYLGAMR